MSIIIDIYINKYRNIYIISSDVYFEFRIMDESDYREIKTMEEEIWNRIQENGLLV